MAKKFWCISPTNPLIDQIAKKYNLSQKDAKTVLNTAIRDNAELQGDNVDLDFLEKQESFQKALEAYTTEFLKAENPLLQDVYGEAKSVRDYKEAIREEYGVELSDDEAQEIYERKNDIPRSVRLSKKNAKKIRDVLKAFPDSRRMEFIGNWVCHMLSDFITQVQLDPQLRKQYKIKKQKNRIDYFADTNTMNAFRAYVFGDADISDEMGILERQANRLEKEGKHQLANELAAAYDNLETLLFMYGGNIFRGEGVSVDIGGMFTKTDAAPTSAERNDVDTEEDDTEDDGEAPVTLFSASDQNKSIFTKMVPEIKMLLNTMHDKKANGEDKTDAYGYGLHTYVPVNEAVNKLLRLCKGCETFSEMVKTLQANQGNTPWLTQLIAALDTESEMDMSGKNRVSKSKKEQLQSMFFKSFRKQFTRFRHTYQTLDERGDIVFVSTESNQKGKTEQLTQRLQNRLRKMRGIDIIKNKKFDYNSLQALDAKIGDTDKSKSFGEVGRQLNAALSEAKKIYKSSKALGQRQSYKDANALLDKAQTELVDVLKKFGIDATDKMLSDYSANDPYGRSIASVLGAGSEDYGDQTFATRYIRLTSLVKQVKNLNKVMKAWVAEGKDEPTISPFSRKVTDTEHAYPIRTAYRTLIANITEFSPDSYESMTHIKGKSFYSWNNPSSIQTVIECLRTGGREAVRKYIEEKYCRDSLWYLMPESEDVLLQGRARANEEKGPAFYSDLLDALYYGNESEKIDYSEVLQFAGNTYNDMSDVSYALSMLNDYFTIQDFGLKSAKSRAWYRMFIAGDKPRYVTINLPRYSERNALEPEKDFHNIIARKAVNFFAQEIRRSENVISYAAKNPDGLQIENYDVNPNKEEFKPVFNKIKAGQRVTVNDVVKDGRYIFRNTGASFFLNKFINGEIEQNTTLGQYVVDRIFNSHLYSQPRAAVDASIMSEFKTGFAAYMTSMRDSFLDKMKEIGLLEERVTKDEEGHSSAHLKYLIGNMRQWNSDNAHYGKFLLAKTSDVNRLAQQDGIDLSEKENAKYKTYYKELAQFSSELEEYIYNNWLAKANMSELFDIDLAFYGDTTNFQKRNAQVVSSGHTTDPEARIHGKRVSDGNYRSITIKTPFEPSTHLNNIRALLERRLKQITDPLQKRQFEIGMNDTLDKLGNQDTTDGQSYVGLTALRKKLAGQGEWSRSDDELDDDRSDIYTDEAVYRRLKRGYKDKNGKALPEEVKTNDLLHVFGQIQKDFVYTTGHFARPGRGTISVPIQHKNSEYMVTFLNSFMALENPGSQIEAIARFLEESAEAEENASQEEKDTALTKGIDAVHFDSVVKIGGNNKAIDLTKKNGKQTLTALRTAVYGRGKKANYRNYKPGIVTEFDCKDYKIVQEKPEHYKKTQQPTGSQFKILAINNIPDTTTITLPDGKTITGKELKNRYFRALKKKTESQEIEFRKTFGLRRPASSRLHKMSIALKNAMGSDQKFTVEMRRALSIIERNGADRFVTPLDEPGMQAAVESLLLSKMRRVFYKQKSNGGIVVQATSWGAAEDLHIRFYSSNPEDVDGLIPIGASEDYCRKWQTGYAYFEFEAPMPDYVKNMIANPNGTVDAVYFNEDGSWNMEEIKKKVPDSVFDAICYRIPTEAKYSMMACRLVRFSRESGGSVAKYPKELTTFTGADFDIDTDTVELRPMPSQKYNKDIDNELFDLELAALRSDPAIGETFKPGDFSDLSEASYYLTLLEKGYPKETLKAMSTKQLKNLCKQVEDLDLMNPMTDVILHNQNSDASSMIGIAAVGVTSHAFMSLYNDIDLNNEARDPKKHPENFLRIAFKESDGAKKNGESFTIVNDSDPNHTTQLYIGGNVLLDLMYDMDGKLISTEISKYVGASADAAKDAALYRLGLNQRTLPIAILMHRMGISSDVIRVFMKQPIIKDLQTRMNAPSDSGKISIKEACRILRNELIDTAYSDLSFSERQKKLKGLMKDIKRDTDIVLSYSDLEEIVADPSKLSIEGAFTILQVFETLADKAEDLRNLDGFTRYNSPRAMKGSSFFDRYVSRNRLIKLSNSLAGGDKALFKLPKDVKILEGYSNDEFGRLCSMFPHIAQIINGEEEMLNDLILENMKTYNPAFFDLIDRFDIGEDADAMRDLYAGWKNYLLFVSDKRIADFRTNKDSALGYTKYYADIYDQELEELKKDPAVKEFLENNSFIASIDHKHVKDQYGDFDVLYSDSIRLTGAALEAFQRDWEELVKNPATRQLAVDVSIHFLARSAAFARDTPVTLMPYEVKKAIPGYLDAFMDADKIYFDEAELDKFVVDFCRNNAFNRKFVPYLKEKDSDTSPHIVPDAEGNPVLKCGTEASFALSKNIYSVSDGNVKRYYLRSPIIQFENKNGERQLYIAIDDEVEVQKIGNNNYYIIPVDTTSPLGIPEQLSEYTGKDYTEESMYLDEGQQAPAPEAGDESQTIEPQEVTEQDIEDFIFDDEDIERGQVVGSYFDAPLFEDTNIDAEVREMLAREPIDYKNNPFLESRTYLKRAGRIARALGLSLRTTQRGYTVGAEQNAEASYFLGITQQLDLGIGGIENPHENALRYGAVMSALSGPKNSGVTVTTYTRNITEANAVHFSIKTSLPESKIKDIITHPDVTVTYNADTKELTLFNYFTMESPGERLMELRAFIDDAKQVANAYDIQGKFEVNFARMDHLNKREQSNLLKTIRDESRDEESERDAERANQEALGEGRNDGRQEVRFSDIAELALMRLEGRDVEDEIMHMFNERYAPLTSADTSYRSWRLSREVQRRTSDIEELRDIHMAEMDEQVDDILAHKSGVETNRLHALDNLIINAANWILGNRSRDTLEEMMNELGLSEEHANSIIATIKQVLKEQDIC